MVKIQRVGWSFLFKSFFLLVSSSFAFSSLFLLFRWLWLGSFFLLITCFGFFFLGFLCAFSLDGFFILIIVRVFTFLFALSFQVLFIDIILFDPGLVIFFEGLKFLMVFIFHILFYIFIQTSPKTFDFFHFFRMVFQLFQFLTSELEVGIQRFFGFVVLSFLRNSHLAIQIK